MPDRVQTGQDHACCRAQSKEGADGSSPRRWASSNQSLRTSQPVTRTQLWQSLETPSTKTRNLLSKAIPRGSFLHEYMAYSDSQETAWSFDLLCALWVMSSVLGRGVQVARGSDRLALNLYILLVAPSGVARKSTALGLAQRLWDHCRPPSSVTVSQRLSPEKLSERLSTSPHCAFIASELVSLLGRAGYSHLLPSLLTDIYDCRGDIYPTFLAASTPTWLTKSLTPDTITGGFGSRLLTVVATRPKRTIPWPEEREHEQRFLERAHRLLHGCEATLTLSGGARAAYIRWYTRHTSVPRDGDYAPAFASRQPDHILKLAGLLSLNRGSALIDEHDIRAARCLVDNCARAGASVFGDIERDETRTRADVLESRIADLQRILEQGGTAWVSQATLTQHFAHRINARGLRNILDAMHDLRMVQRAESTGKGRTTTLWRGTTLLREVPTGVLLSTVDKTR
jgi:hypothetical protein